MKVIPEKRRVTNFDIHVCISSKAKNKTYHTIGTIPKSNIKIIERGIVCHLLCFRSAIALAVFRCTACNYLFDIFKLFFIWNSSIFDIQNVFHVVRIVANTA